MGKNATSTKHRKTRDFLAGPTLLRQGRRPLSPTASWLLLLLLPLLLLLVLLLLLLLFLLFLLLLWLLAPGC